MGINIHSKFWKDKNVLLTGHTGFKGAWLTLWLTELGANITGFSLDIQTEPNLYSLLSLSKRIKDFRGDIFDYNTINEVMKNTRPDIVIHMAAQALVRESYKSPLFTYNTNVSGTVNLLESARKIDSVKSVIVVTSDKCYENKEIDYFYSESNRLGGKDPYSSSKACAEIITSAYRTSFYNNKDIGLATARAGNVIGGGDWSKDRLVPDAIKAFNDGQILDIRSPDSIRPWQFVLEPLSGYLKLCEKLWESPVDYSTGWNFGPEKSNIKKVGKIADIIKKLWGNGADWRYLPDSKLKEAKLLHLNSEKAKNRLGWKPKISIEMALKHTVDWYYNYYNSKKLVKQLSLEQLYDYLDNE